MAEIASYLQSVKLPVMPEVAQALIRTLNEDDADITKIRDVIAKDPALTATLLRMANSAIFGLSRSVTTLEAAVNVVGTSQIRARALSICMANVFSLPPGIDRMAFWRDSMTCAGYAKWLAVARGMDEHQAWLTGMMLRLGELIIGQKDQACIEKIELTPRRPGERWQRERSLCGFDEGQITAEIARRWDFPDAVVNALAASTQPLEAANFSDLGAVIHLAGLLSEYPEVTAETLAELPESIVHKLELNLLWMSVHLPDARAFSDTSMLQA